MSVSHLAQLRELQDENAKLNGIDPVNSCSGVTVERKTT
jgi:hypothetical protein